MTRSSMASMIRSINSASAGLFEFDKVLALCPVAPVVARPKGVLSPSVPAGPPVPKIELPGPPVAVDVGSRRTTFEPVAERKIVVVSDGTSALLVDDPPDDDPPDDERLIVDDDAPDDDEDDDERDLRSEAGRADGLRRMVPAAGVGDGPAGPPGDDAASAPIRPPLAPTTIPAVPNVGMRLSFDCIRRIVSAADAAPAIDGGCTARIRFPVARARSSSGE